MSMAQLIGKKAEARGAEARDEMRRHEGANQALDFAAGKLTEHKLVIKKLCTDGTLSEPQCAAAIEAVDDGIRILDEIAKDSYSQTVLSQGRYTEAMAMLDICEILFKDEMKARNLLIQTTPMAAAKGEAVVVPSEVTYKPSPDSEAPPRGMRQGTRRTRHVKPGPQ
jgi:hypothetical protein